MIFTPNFTLKFISSIGYIPSLTILLATFKFSNSPTPTQNLYRYLESKDINQDELGLIFGILSSLILFGMSLIYDLFTCEIRHSFSKFNLSSKKNSNIDVFYRAYETINVIFYVFLGFEHILFYLVCVMISTCVIFYVHLIMNPYYNLHANLVCVTKLIVQ